MARGTNTFSLGTGFNITGQEPIDSRLVVGTLSDLTTQETWNGVGLYNGLVVAVTESSTLYVLKNRDDVTNPESWVAVGGDVSADLAELTADVEGLKTSKQDKIIAGNGIDLNADGKTVSIKIDSTGQGLELGPNGLKAVIPEAAEYTIAAADTPTEGYLKSYELRKNGAKVGVSIDIPKDLVVTKGEVKEVEEENIPYEGAVIGDLYLELTIANQGTPVYIPVKSLTDVYTGSTYISVDAGVISIKYNDLKGQINTDLVTPVSGRVTTVEGKVATLETTVGNVSSGLVKDVNDLKTNIDQKVDKVEGSSLITSEKLALIDTNASKIGTLETTVSTKLDNTATVNGQSFVGGACTINATHINIEDKIGDNVAGTSIEEVLSNFNDKITDAADAGVQSFGGKTGAITVKGGNDGSTPAVNLIMSDNELQATPVGVASSTQGEKADSALQSVTASSSSTYLTLSVNSKAENSQAITGNLKVQSIESAATESKGLAESYDVKQYIDNMFVWEELE